MYTQDWNDRYPYTGYQTSSFGFYRVTWDECLAVYSIFSTNAGINCPGYRSPFATNAIFNLSYGYNATGSYYHWNPNRPQSCLGLGPDGQAPGVNPLGFHIAPIPVSAVRAPGEMFAVADARLENETLNQPGGGGQGMTWRGVPVHGLYGWSLDIMICGVTGEIISYYPFPLRHGKNYNVVYCDGHVSGMDPAIMHNPSKTAVLWNNDHQPHPETWLQ